MTGCGAISGQPLKMLFEFFHMAMVSELKKIRRRDLSEALKFWLRAKEHGSLIVSPVPFMKLAKALLTTKATSYTAESMFRDLGAIESNRR